MKGVRGFFVGIIATLWMTVALSEVQQTRAFSEDYITGVYGRFFELSQEGNAAPCPVVINHLKRGSRSESGDSWVVPHSEILQNGVLCKGDGDLVLQDFDKNSLPPTSLQVNNVALQTFQIMTNESTGFWMGTDSRTCGKWNFPEPSFIFFLREFKREILSLFNLKLAPGRKYMFVAAPTFTCIYDDIPQSEAGATPSAILPDRGETAMSTTDADLNETSSAPSGTIGNTNGMGTATTDPADESTTEIVSASESPSAENDESVDDEITTAPSHENTTILDIAEGSTAVPEETNSGTEDESIVDIAAASGDSSDNEISLLQPSPGEEVDDSETVNGTDEGDEDDPFDIDSNSGESLCFPSTATVELRDGAVVEMRGLAVGDEVKVASGKFSPIFTFTHRSDEGIYLFVRLETRCGKSLKLTPGHMLYVNGSLKRASEAKIGHVLLTGSGVRTDITNVSYVRDRGVFNPQTVQGDIIVDGILASTYTSSVVPETAHGLLAPLRALWSVARLNMLGPLLNSHSISKEILSFRRLLSA